MTGGVPQQGGLRVLFFSDAFWPRIGGVEVLTSRLVPALAAAGHQILVVTDRSHPSLPEEDEIGGVPIRRVPFSDPLHARDVDGVAAASSALTAIARDFRPDLVHAVFIGPSLWYLPRVTGVPTLLDCHGSWPEITPRPDGLFARLAGAASWVTAVSQSALDDVFRVVPEVRADTRMMPYGVDPAVPDEPPEPPPGAPVVLCTGRMVPEKGMDVALAAMAEVLRRRPDARLVLGGDGPERPVLERQASELGIADRVAFPGWISPPRAHEVVAGAHLVLVPSRLEGFGIVALEASLMARPVVASGIGGLTEAVADGVSGVLVRPDDPGALAGAILGLLDDPERARALGRAGRERALADFSQAAYVARWHALYIEIGEELHGR